MSFLMMLLLAVIPGCIQGSAPSQSAAPSSWALVSGGEFPPVSLHGLIQPVKALRSSSPISSSFHPQKMKISVASGTAEEGIAWKPQLSRLCLIKWVASTVKVKYL